MNALQQLKNAYGNNKFYHSEAQSVLGTRAKCFELVNKGLLINHPETNQYSINPNWKVTHRVKMSSGKYVTVTFEAGMNAYKRDYPNRSYANKTPYHY